MVGPRLCCLCLLLCAGQAATVHVATGLQGGSALPAHVLLMEGSVVEMLLRQGRLHIIITQPDK